MAATKTIDQIFATCLALYPLTGADKEQDKIDLLRNAWHAVLADVPDELLNTVAVDYFKHAHEWRPTPGHLYEAAMKASEQSSSALAEQAWLETKEAIYFNDRINDPLALKAAQLVGGSDAFANVKTDELHFLKDRFVRAYQSLKESETARGGLLLNRGAEVKRLK